MYIIFDEQIIDSEEIKNLIEEKSNFKVEKDMCKATKREDVLAYLLTLDVDLIKKEIEEESGVSRNTVSTLIDKLVELDILVPDSNYAKLAYRYNEIYNVFIGKDMT